MKKTVSPSYFLAATSLAFAFSFAPHSFAQVAPRQAALANIDKRLEGRDAAPLSADKKVALDNLRSQLPGLKADIDPLLNSPTYIAAGKGFLTGADGVGGTVSADVAKDIPESDPHRPIKAFLTEHKKAFGHGADVLSTAKIKREFAAGHSGLKTTVWQQQLNGIPVYKALLIGHVTKNGELVNLSTHFLADVAKAADAAPKNPGISAAEAIIIAAKNIGGELALNQVTPLGAAKGVTLQQRFKAAPVLKGDLVAELVWLPMSGTEVRLCWQILLSSAERGEMFQSVVDAQTGEIIIRHGLTEYISDATYNVYTSDSPSPFSPGHQTPSPLQPPLVPRVLVTTSAVSVNASPNGWINDGDSETLGNNVDAHLDRDDDDQPDLPRPNGGATRTFNFTLDLNQAPTTYGDASVVQLFYWNNWYHDKLYDLGFNEAAGNFQTDNFGRGGVAGDPVLADAQDGISLNDPFHDNNANMGTPPDGFSPRMQMYKFSGPNPDRDGDLDAEVIIHEHTHGLSNRRVGGGVGLANLQSRGMGEGWGDFYALTLLSEPSDDINGAYASGGYPTRDLFGLVENYYFGIRRYPYSTDLTKNPLTYKDIDPAQASLHPGIPTSPLFVGSPGDEVHNQGEIWCVTLWEARAAMINKHGFAVGNQLILQLVTDGMNLTPADPTFLQARDGILLADEVLTGGANQNELWAAFAKRGMGALAGSPVSTTTAGVIESYDVPGLALLSTAISGGNGNGIIDFNECNSLQLVLTNIGLDASNITVTLTTTTPEVIVAQSLSTYPNIPAGGSGVNFTPIRISTSPDFVCGTPIDLTLLIKSDVDTRTNFFRLPTGTVGTPIRFNNNTPLLIPDANPIGVSSPIVVSNFNGTVGKVTVGLYLTHTFDFDLLLQLIAPDGTTITLSQNNGGAGDNFGSSCSPDALRTRFDDDANLAIAAANPPFIGSFQPDQPLSNFNLKSGTNVNGTWQLKVVDQIPIDVGAIQCWSLFLSPQTCTDGGGECPGSDLAVSMVATPDPAIQGTNLTYTITITNHGPSTAKAVVLSQLLPAGSTFVSATASQGTSQHSGGTVTCNLGTIGARRSATVTVVVIPTIEGTASSTAAVGSGQTDPDPSNNSVTVLTRVVPPSADLSVTVTDSPDPVSAGADLTYTITVANHGPTIANGVFLTNTLPNTAAFISANSTQGNFVNVGGTIINNLGTMTNGAVAVVTIVVRPTVVGAITETSRVTSSQADLFPGNNVASATTTVSPAADLVLSIVDMPDPVVTTSNITYVITLSNRGPNMASSVVINGSLPSSAVFVSGINSAGTFSVNANNFTANVTDPFTSGSTAILTIVMTAPNTPQTLNLTATASASQADPILANNSVSETTLVANPFVSIVQAGATLVSEVAPANGSIDSGETVSVILRLRNGGNINSTNIVATLLSTGGVTSLSTPQTYGLLASGGPSVGKTFSFTANGGSGQNITAILQIQDVGGTFTNVTFTFTLPTITTFSNTNAIVIPDHGPASPYPSQITVSNVSGLVGKVTVKLDKINHTYPDDIDVLLVDPTGRKVLLMADTGGGNLLSGVSLTLDPAAATALANEDQLTSGSFRVANYSPDDDFFTNAPAGPYENSLHGFDGTAPNGIWSLYVVDDTEGDQGNITGGWNLSITTLAPVNKIADLNITATNSVGSILVNEAATYTFNVVNNGPDTATNVVVNNPLPSNAIANSPLTFNLGNMAIGASTNFAVNLTLTALGSFTNVATVSADEVDLNPLNNAASVVTFVGYPSADLGVSISASANPILGFGYTYTILVTNKGPDTAFNIGFTDQLPPSTSFVSANASQGTVSNSAGIVTGALGHLAANTSATISITVTPSAAGIISNSVSVTTSSSDPSGANNAANFISVVVNPMPSIVASGATLVSESSVTNGGIDPGETVQIAFHLANLGTANTVNLVATLQASGGVTSSSSQNYGVVVYDGPAISRNFTFTATGVIGGTVTATLQLQDGANNLGNVTFVFDLPKSGSYTNNTSVAVPNSGPATPYPSTITVTNGIGVVSTVAVTLNGLTHSFPDDLDILLVGPDGQKVMLMSDVGGAHSISSLNLAFNDSGAFLSNSNQISSGSFRPTDYEVGESLPPAAPAAPYASAFNTFIGSNPNGDWSLYINDDTGGDSGSLSGGWNLFLTTINPINPLVATPSTLGSATALPDGSFNLTLIGQAGTTYRIDASSNMTIWIPVNTNTAAGDGTFQFTDTAATNFNPRFYRAVQLP